MSTDPREQKAPNPALWRKEATDKKPDRDADEKQHQKHQERGQCGT